MSPLLAFLLGALVVALICVPWGIRELRRRRLAEQQRSCAQQSADKSSNLLEAAPDGFFLWDVPGDYSQCSRRLAVLLELPTGTDSSLADILDRFEGDSAKQLKRAIEALREQGMPFDLTLLLKSNRQILAFGLRTGTSDGRPLADVLWMRAKPELITAPAPKIETEAPIEADAEIAGPIEKPSDVAPAEVIQAVLDDNDMVAVLNSLSTPLAIFGADARLEHFNDAYANFWELPADWLDTHPTLNQVLDAIRERRLLPEVANFVTYKAEQRALFGTLSGPKEILIHQPNGATIKSTINPTDVGGLVFAFEDVTDHLALERSVNTLVAVQRETLDHLHEGIAVFGGDGRLKFFNPVFSSLWKFSSGQVASGELQTGMHIAEIIDDLQPEFGKRSLEPAEKEEQIVHLLNRSPKSKRIHRSDGKTLDFTKAPLPDGAVLLSYVDVSDSALVEDALAQKAAALDEANKLKSTFIANVSYEVQTPLNAVLGFTEVLADEYYGELSPRQKEYVDSIRNTTQSLATIVTDILDLASIEAGLMELKLDSIDIHAMMVSILNLIRENARHKHLKLEFDCVPDIGWMAADEQRLKQVLFNLLSNAIQFTPDHGTITFKADRDGDHVVFTVSDTGPGIPQADQARVFQTFERGNEETVDLSREIDGAPSQQGAGLGLSLVKNFVELHGGNVDLKSRPGRGTTLICRLPSGAAQHEQSA